MQCIAMEVERILDGIILGIMLGGFMCLVLGLIQWKVQKAPLAGHGTMAAGVLLIVIGVISIYPSVLPDLFPDGKVADP